MVLKKLVLVLLIIVLSSYAFAFLELTKTVYGPNKNFEGYLDINKTNVALNEYLNGQVRNCGSYSGKNIMLYDILNKSGVYSGELYSYATIGNSFSSIKFLGNEADYAFKISNPIKNFTFAVSNNLGSLDLDIGLDGYDWKYYGEFDMWGTFIKSLDYNSGFEDYPPNYNNVVERTSRTKRCSEFEIEFKDLQSEYLLRINGVVKRVANTGGVLKALVDKTESCTFEQNIYPEWTDVSCELSLDVGEEESPKVIEVCIYSTSDSGDGDFVMPTVPGTKEYSFIKLNEPVYRNYASGFNIGSSFLKNKINDYYNKKCKGECIIPFRITGDSGYYFYPTLTLNDGSKSKLVYNLEKTVKKYNLTSGDVDLKYFEDLKTPNQSKSNCVVEVDFLGKKYENIFDVTKGPIPIIKVSSEFGAKGIPITFDGSLSSQEVYSWNWNFGDNSSSNGKIVKHTYTKEGDYIITLTVKDNKDVESSANIVIKIVKLEEALEKEIPRKLEVLNKSSFIFNSLKGKLKNFYDDMNFGFVIDGSYKGLRDMKIDFDTVKNSNMTSTQKDLEYKGMFNELESLSGNTPSRLDLLNSSFYINYTVRNIGEVPTFSKIFGLGNLNTIKNQIYNFNQKNVKGDYEYYQIRVNYLGGSEDYIYIEKQFDSTEGGEYIEDLEGYNGVEIFSSGCNIDNSSSVIYCSSVSSNFNIRYAAIADKIILNSGFIVPNDIYEGTEVLYQYDCEGGICGYAYCGDRKCSRFLDLGVDERDKNNQYYCPKDCGRNVPWIWYIVLFIVLLFGIFWINFYRGPGNFFDVTNKITYKLFNRKLFLIEKDKIVLRAYIIRALREGFTEGEIRKALRRKGWTKKQLDYVIGGMRGKKLG